MELDQKVVLITGASEGIGAACVSVLRHRGAHLVLVARSEEKLRQLALPEDLVIAADLTDPAARPHVIEKTIARYGRIDVLINNAGVGMYAPATTSPMPETRQLFELNFFAPLELCQLATPHMPAGSCIVNVASVAGKITLPWFVLYSASKYALHSLSDGLRLELKSRGIHVLNVCPGYIATGFQQHALRGAAPTRLQSARGWFAMSPDDCARAIIRGIEREARTLVVPRVNWLLILLARLFPRLVDAQIMRINREPGTSSDE